jgi:DnaJ-class molecular chaperone
MAIHPDYYGIPGVPKTTPQHQIRKAYKKLAKNIIPMPVPTIHLR